MDVNSDNVNLQLDLIDVGYSVTLKKIRKRLLIDINLHVDSGEVT